LELFYALYVKEGKIALTISQEKLYKGMLVLPSIDPIEENFIASFKHSYTKYRLTVNLYNVDAITDEVVWVELEELKNAPISSLTKKAIAFIET